MIFSSGLLVLVAWALAAQQPPGAQSPYDAWLNEEVVYIINAEERAAFERLTGDDERKKFIEQFWERRSPTPGAGATDENQFMKEHYRRIAYANLRYRAPSGKPGWQTDRGYVYIVYGPADEIESHPSGGAGTAHPYEVWVYRREQGFGGRLFITFRDRTRTGDYRAEPGNAR